MATRVEKNGRNVASSDAALPPAPFTTPDFYVGDLSELTIIFKATGGNLGAVAVNTKDAQGNYVQVASFAPAAASEVHTVGAGCSGAGDSARGFGNIVQVTFAHGTETSFTYTIEGK